MRIQFHLLAIAVCLSTSPLLGAQGLLGRYYSGYSVVSNRITFDGLTLVSTQTNTVFDLWDGTSGYNWDPIGPINYSVRWTGFLRVDEPGVYGFGTISDDGSEIWINGEMVVDNNEEQWYDWQEGYCYLGAGYHTIEITFYEAQTFSGIEVWWLVPSAAPSVLPYSGENFHSIPPTFNSDTQWQILPGSVLSVDAPFLNPRLSAQQGSAPDEVELTWQGYANATYVVESSTDLLNWTEVTGELPGMDAIMTRVLTRSAPHEFFRVKLIPGD